MVDHLVGVGDQGGVDKAVIWAKKIAGLTLSTQRENGDGFGSRAAEITTRPSPYDCDRSTPSSGPAQVGPSRMALFAITGREQVQ
jgi:hypothetical protein